MRTPAEKPAVLPNAEPSPTVAVARRKTVARTSTGLSWVLLAAGLVLASFAGARPAAATDRTSAVGGRTVRMLVTAYCACTKCCGPAAQGVTASGKPVTYNQGRFVAADRTVLKLGQKLKVPGYHDGRAVEVLDTGSAIKGNRLDVYFPSHQKALEWGRQWLDVTVVAD